MIFPEFTIVCFICRVFQVLPICITYSSFLTCIIVFQVLIKLYGTFFHVIYDPFHIDLRMSEIGIVNKSVHLLKSSLYKEASAYITHQRKPGITIQYSIQCNYVFAY